MKEQTEDNITQSPQESQEIEINLIYYIRKLWTRKKFIFKTCIFGIILGLIIGFSIPRRYTVKVTLSPESGKANGANGLAGMASMLGMSNMNLSTGETDALSVALFPDIVVSTPFILELFNTKVKPIESDSSTILYNYLDMQRSPWWSKVIKLPETAIGEIKSIIYPSKKEVESQSINPFKLTPKQASKVDNLRGAMSVTVDKKTGMTTISVTLQDPEVTAVVTDTVMAKLQQYITSYKVSKAKEDCNYLNELYLERQKEYYSAQQEYAHYIDANRNVVLQSVLNERERLQNEMNIAYQVYSQVATQLQVARAKVQEAKPVFAIVEPASVPLRSSGTSKMMILIGFMVLSIIIASSWVIFGENLYGYIKKHKNRN